MSLESRRERLRELMDRLGLGALLMRRPANFAWYTGGADNRVDHADPLGVAGILLTREAEYVLTDNFEAGKRRRISRWSSILGTRDRGPRWVP